jgi:hypothetical protein
MLSRKILDTKQDFNKILDTARKGGQPAFSDLSSPITKDLQFAGNFCQ